MNNLEYCHKFEKHDNSVVVFSRNIVKFKLKLFIVIKGKPEEELESSYIVKIKKREFGRRKFVGLNEK